MLRNKQPYKPVQRAFGLLNHFSLERPELTVSLLAQLSGLHKSTVSRLAKVFEAVGVFERDPATRKYRLGLRLYELGSMYVQGTSLYTIAANALPQLSKQSGHTSYLGVLEGPDVVVLEMSPGTKPLQVVVRAGQHIPAYASAMGRALLTLLPESQLRKLYPSNLRRFTRTTITTGEELETELQVVRRRGYAISNAELSEGVFSVGVAVTGLSARCAGLSVTLPAHPKPSRRAIQELADMLRRKTAEIEVKAFPASRHIGRLPRRAG